MGRKERCVGGSRGSQVHSPSTLPAGCPVGEEAASTGKAGGGQAGSGISPTPPHPHPHLSLEASNPQPLADRKNEEAFVVRALFNRRRGSPVKSPGW